MRTTQKPLSAIWQEMVHKAHTLLCKELGSVPQWKVEEMANRYEREAQQLRDRLDDYKYQLDMTNSPVWHGPWKIRKDGKGKYRSVKVNKVVSQWRSQKVSFETDYSLTAYDGDPICRGVSSWYDKIPVCPWVARTKAAEVTDDNASF